MAPEAEQDLITLESSEELQEFLRDQSNIHFICGAHIAGIFECLTLLEHRDYKPDTSRNDLFIVRSLTWSTLSWFIVSIPVEEKHLMESAADENDLRIVKGWPMAVSSAGLTQFPVSGENVFILGYKPGHPMYKNDPEVTRALQEGVDEALDRIRKTKF